MAAQGRIMKATGGFYYVQTSQERIECRARGLFRKEGITPFVGDIVNVEENTVIEIMPRKNHLIRPPVANLDYMVLVLSVTDPAPNLLVADKLIAVLESKEISPVIAITKNDLETSEPLNTLYGSVGFPVHTVNSVTGEGMKELTDALAGKLCVFAGNSGVGKSSLLNAINPHFEIEVGDTSKKLGRGKHTTRHVEIYTLENNAMLVDTPGFSSIDLVQMSDLRAADLADCFREFAGYTHCRFQDCAHIHETGCGVRAAAEEGKIAASRYQSYCQLYSELKDLKEWDIKR